MDEQPMGNATIVMESKNGGPAASAVSQEDGTFVLTTFDANDGAVAGDFSVIVMKYEKFVNPPGVNPDTAPTKPAALISPPRYSDFMTSGLTAHINENGDNRIELKLTTSPK